MSTLTTPREANEANVAAEGTADHERSFAALRRLIERGSGKFALVLIEFDLPRQRQAIIDTLRAASPDSNIVTVALSPPPADAPRAFNVLDQLEELVKTASPQAVPDALVITGYETLFPHDTDAVDSQSAEQLARAIQPLNLGRNLLSEKFPHPVLLCLPTDAMAAFLRSAPDLRSWRSGYYQFRSDLHAVRAELARAARAGTGWRARWQLRGRAAEELQAEAKYLEALIADAEALPAQQKVTARLYDRLGWISITLGNRTGARRAFAEVLRLGRDTDDARLIRDAERGQRAAAHIKSHVRVSPEQDSSKSVFRGAAALTAAEGLYGREEELRRLVGQVTPVAARFLTVWGETGCGKSSLVLAGLVPELDGAGRYLPVVVREWADAEQNVRHALEQESKLSLSSFATLRDCVEHVAQQTAKTVVIICDQFEQFFTSHAGRGARVPFIKSVGECVGDYRVACKFILIVREDELGRLTEFDDEVPEPLEQRKRFYLPLFSAADAVRALSQLSGRANLGWPDAFIREVVSDLTRDGRVRPVELQLVGAALEASEINNSLDYARAGKAQGLLVDYIGLILDRAADNKGELQVMKQVLLALVADPSGRLTLSPAEIARRANLKPKVVEGVLRSLEERHLVRSVQNIPLETEAVRGRDAPPAHLTDKVQYELTHDVLTDLVLLLTRDLQDKRRQANRILERALEDSFVNPRHVISLRDRRLVRNNVNEEELAKPKTKALLRRSLRWGALRVLLWLTLVPAVIVAALAAVQYNSGYVSLEFDFNNRVVIRRGLPWLGFLPVIGDEAVILDTGFTHEDVKPTEAETINDRLIHWEWGNRQSGAMRLPKFIESLKPEPRGVLLSQLGRWNEAFAILRDVTIYGDAINSGNRPVITEFVAKPDLTLNVWEEAKKTESIEVRAQAVRALGRAALLKPELAHRMVEPLSEEMQRHSESYAASSHAAESLGRLAQADKKLAGQVFGLLLGVLRRDGVYPDLQRLYMQVAAVKAMGGVVEADPELAGQALRPLQSVLMIDNSWMESYAAAGSLGQVAEADPELADEVIDSLLAGLKAKSIGVDRRVVSKAIIRAIKAKPRLADKMLRPLMTALLDMDARESPLGETLGEVAARADSRLVDSAFPTLLDAMKGEGEWVRVSVTRAVGRLVEARPELADRAIDPLLQVMDDPGAGGRFTFARDEAAKSLGRLVKVKPELAGRTLGPLLWLFLGYGDKFSDGTSGRDSALAQVMQADSEFAKQVLENNLRKIQSGPSNREATGIARSCGEAVKARPDLASKAVEGLLNTLKTGNLEGRVVAVRALGEVAQAEPKVADKVLQPLLKSLGDNDTGMRKAAMSSLFQVVKADPKLASETATLVDLLKSEDPAMRQGMSVDSSMSLDRSMSLDHRMSLNRRMPVDPTIRQMMSGVFADMFVALAEENPQPVRFLFDHLEGRRSFMLSGDANTYAVYRNVIVGALARWLISDKPKAKLEREKLLRELERLRDESKQLHLSIAAWNVFAEADRLQEERDLSLRDPLW